MARVIWGHCNNDMNLINDMRVFIVFTSDWNISEPQLCVFYLYRKEM